MRKLARTMTAAVASFCPPFGHYDHHNYIDRLCVFIGRSCGLSAGPTAPILLRETITMASMRRLPLSSSKNNPSVADRPWSCIHPHSVETAFRSPVHIEIRPLERCCNQDVGLWWALPWSAVIFEEELGRVALRRVDQRPRISRRLRSCQTPLRVPFGGHHVVCSVPRRRAFRRGS
jgi:hypothetical protein